MNLPEVPSQQKVSLVAKGKEMRVMGHYHSAVQHTHTISGLGGPDVTKSCNSCI